MHRNIAEAYRVLYRVMDTPISGLVNLSKNDLKHLEVPEAACQIDIFNLITNLSEKYKPGRANAKLCKRTKNKKLPTLGRKRKAKSG